MKLQLFLIFATITLSALASPLPHTTSRQPNIFTRLLRIFRRAGPITENGVEDNNGCQPLTLIFARGTSEPGNMGDDVGPPVATQLRALLANNVTVQGVDYPASWPGNLLFGLEGSPKMIDLTKQALSQCPNSKIALSGYSQGAMVVHKALLGLPGADVSSVVLFGDPLIHEPILTVPESRIKEFCEEGDPVCQNGLDFDAHGRYAKYAGQAAEFMVKAAGL